MLNIALNILYEKGTNDSLWLLNFNITMGLFKFHPIIEK